MKQTTAVVVSRFHCLLLLLSLFSLRIDRLLWFPDDCVAFSPALPVLHSTTTFRESTSCVLVPIAPTKYHVKRNSQVLLRSHRLSHAMFRVPSVVDSVNFWVTHLNATMGRHSRDDATGQLKGAFVTIPSSAAETPNRIDNDEANTFEMGSFALELTSSKGRWEVGNCIGGIDVPQSVSERSVSSLDPNGIACMVSPTDDIRLVLRTNAPLDDLRDFYTTILGMTAVPSCKNDHYTPEVIIGSDGSTMPLCMCYQNGIEEFLPTTSLVFLQSDIPIEQGDCFDHFVIEIDEKQTSIAEEYTRITAAMAHAKELARAQERNFSGALLMKPTTMFGTDIMGLRDPSGYKVYLATPAKPL